MACILSAMSFYAITLAVVLVVALLVLAAWLFGRLALERNGTDGGAGQETQRRFDTTRGELRDLREALGAAGGAGRSPQSTRSKHGGVASSRAASTIGESPAD
jgi:hypothetical protein